MDKIKTYRDVYNELSRLQSISLKLASTQEKDSSSNPDRFNSIVATTLELRSQLEAEVAKNLAYLRERQGSVVSMPEKAYEYEPAPAIEQIATT